MRKAENVKQLRLVPIVLVLIASGPVAGDAAQAPLHRTVDLNRGESQELELSDGTAAKVKLLEVEEIRDGLRLAIRQARVMVEVNGETVTLIVDLTEARYALVPTYGPSPR